MPNPPDSPPVGRKSTTSTALLTTLSDSAALPALVERLQPRELKDLVDAVGLEDAGALVSYASPAQLAHLVDESVWASVNPGDPETLSVPELLRWFDLWLDIGEGFIAEKLVELGEGFCALAFARLISVTAVDLAPGELDEFSQTIGEYLIRSTFEDEWDTVQAALAGLWDDSPDFLEALFARLSFRHSILGIRGEDDAERVLEADAGHEREQRKEAGGFVGATTAGAFLRDVANADLDLLVDEASYDAETAEYFKRQTRKVDEPAADPASAAEDAADVGDADDSEDTEAELDALQRELEAYEVLRGEHVALLTGPEQPQEAAVLPVRRALASLANDPDCLAARSSELAYLSNVVMAQVSLGHTKDAQKLTETEAANLVMATCNLGGSYVLWADAREAEESAEQSPFVDMLTEEPGLVRLFRVGWNLISHLPVQAANRLSRSLSSDEAGERLATRPWLASEVAALLGEPNLVDVVREGGFDQAKDTLEILSLALEPIAISALGLLIDGVPRLAEALEDGGLADDPDAAPRARYIASMKDLLLLDRFLSQLHHQLRE